MYYTIENSTDKEVGNVFPQVSSVNQNLAHSIPFDEFINLDSELLFELQSKAKLTDVLSQAAISAHGLLINKKVKDLFKDFNLMQHRYYKCLVKDLNGVTHDYYWLHLVDDFKNKIDYSKSTFYWTRSTFRKGMINLTSFDDYLDQKKQNGVLWGISIEKVVLNENFAVLDMFSCIPFDQGIYVSSILKNKIIQEGISGIYTEEALKFI